jgi:hypothetical protein
MGCVAFVCCCALTAPYADAVGVVEGTVVNGSRGQTPVSGAKVVLRADHEGTLVPIAETTADNQGKFRFEQIPVSHNLVCLPGANYEGIHYPGTRVRIAGPTTAPAQKIVVYESVADPSPLVATRHEIDIRLDDGVLEATETIIVANRSLWSYVGSETDDGQPSATLRLSIPAQFKKVTFAKEFFGRQFQLNKETVETQIPWTPGQRELKFTYRLPIEDGHWSFRRPLDLPTEQMRLRVHGVRLNDVACNVTQAGELQDNAVVFDADSGTLPAGHTIELQFGNLPVSWTTYARWGAVAALAVLVLGTATFISRRRRTPSVGSASTERAIRPTARAA